MLTSPPVALFRGEPTAPAYGASKAGMNAFGQSMAQALIKHNIFIYTLAPGYVETERVAPILEGPEGENIKNQSPFGRVAKPEEVARAAVLLASEGTDFMTGCIVDIKRRLLSQNIKQRPLFYLISSIDVQTARSSYLRRDTFEISNESIHINILFCLCCFWA